MKRQSTTTVSQVSAIAVVRISGPKASLVLSDMVSPISLHHHRKTSTGSHNTKNSNSDEKTEKKSQVTPRRAYYCKLKHPKSGQILDHALCFYFPGPNSFTGEDVVELHIHGGHSVQSDVIGALSDIDESFQVAQPGDFTKRAFLNGKMDLTEVEALSDLLHAQTEQQRLQALKQLDGSLSKIIDTWSKDVMYAVAHLTAFIDFGEDDDINDSVYRLILPRIDNLCQQIQKHLSQGNKGERLRNGAQVALLGPPNAGKSSLLNVLAKRPVAIVSDIQGTTRDVVEVHLNIEGYAVTVADTAGIRQDQNENYAMQPGVSQINDIEREGMIRALDRAKDADVLVLVMDPDDTESNRHCLQRLKEQHNDQQHVVIAHNKSDKVNRSLTESAISTEYANLNAREFLLSCKTGEGIDSFVQYLGECMKMMFSPTHQQNASTSTGETSQDKSATSDTQEQIIITRERHRQALQNCLDNLKLFLKYHQEIDIAAEYLRQAHGYLASITGHVDTEDILGLVFKEFCIGK